MSKHILSFLTLAFAFGTFLFGAIGAFGLLGTSPANAEANRIGAQRAKLAELRKVWGAFNVPAGTPVATDTARKTTERDSGREQVSLFIKKTNFRFFNNIGFYVPELVAILKATDPTQPVVFDDPFSFSINPIQGKAQLSSAVLSELMNSHVFNFKGAPLRKITVTTKPDKLVFKGQMNRRGKWVPFKMTGPVSLEKGHVLVFAPIEVLVDGKNAGPVLKAANVTLDELLTVKAPGAVLIGSKVYLDALALFPPPKLQFSIKTAKLTAKGLELVFQNVDSKKKPAQLIKFPDPIIKNDSHIMVRGGDVKFFRAVAVNSDVLIVNKDDGKPLDFSLYDYREQILGGHIKFTKSGAVLAYLQNYDAKLIGN